MCHTTRHTDPMGGDKLTCALLEHIFFFDPSFFQIEEIRLIAFRESNTRIFQQEIYSFKNLSARDTIREIDWILFNIVAVNHQRLSLLRLRILS